MSELKAEQWLDYAGEPRPCYPKSEADKVIAEKDKDIARLEAMRKVHVEAIASMEDRLHQDEKKIRRLKRLLWHAIALFCARSCEYFSGIMSHCLMGQDDLYRRCEEKKNKYLHAVYKCRAKAEEYK